MKFKETDYYWDYVRPATGFLILGCAFSAAFVLAVVPPFLIIKWMVGQ